MKTWTIRKRILLGFSVITIIAMGLGLFAFGQLRAISEHSVRITSNSLPTLYRAGQLAEKIQFIGNQNSTLVLKSLISSNDDLKTELQEQIGKNLESMAALVTVYQTSIGDIQGRTSFIALEKERLSYVHTINEILKLSAAGSTQEGMEMKQGQLEPTFERILSAVHAEVDFNKSKGDEAGLQILTAVNSAKRGILIGLCCVLIAGSSISYVIIVGTSNVLKAVAHSLQQNSERVSAEAGQILATSQELAHAGSSQASSLEETSSSLEEMAAMTVKSVADADDAKVLSGEARNAAEVGASGVEEIGRVMQAIQASSDDVAKIIKTIDEIAFQTKILALNAAVEAARAGESGAGFAVVADEVKNLAHRSALAAKETAEKVEESLHRSKLGVAVSLKITASFQEIVAKARQVDQLIAGIAAVSLEQSQGIAEVNTSVTQISQITQTNASRAQETAEGAESLSTQAIEMKAAVDSLLKLVGSSAIKADLNSAPDDELQSPEILAALPAAG